MYLYLVSCHVAPATLTLWSWQSESAYQCNSKSFQLKACKVSAQTVIRTCTLLNALCTATTRDMRSQGDTNHRSIGRELSTSATTVESFLAMRLVERDLATPLKRWHAFLAKRTYSLAVVPAEKTAIVSIRVVLPSVALSSHVSREYPQNYMYSKRDSAMVNANKISRYQPHKIRDRKYRFAILGVPWGESAIVPSCHTLFFALTQSYKSK